MRGRLITIEGLDGAGKTTVVQGLVADLRGKGIAVHAFREPGGVEVSERIRALVQEPGVEITARTEALLFAAARAQLVEEVLVPVLERGEWIVLDRFVDSSLAYQGGARGLGIEQIQEINDFAIAGLQPDRTILLTVDLEVGLKRRGDRVADRMESESHQFFSAVDATYRQLAAENPQRIKVVNGEQGPDQVLSNVLETIEDLVADFEPS